MISRLIKTIFGSRHERLVKGYRKRVQAINALEPSMQALSDEALAAKTDEFKARLAQGERLDNLMTEAFAVVREAAVRVFAMRHFDVQLIGGMVLNDGRIAEMLTGEGKTLTSTLAIYLNALTGQGVHVITVNDYLAQRDAALMGQLYGFLGLTTGVILSGHQQGADEKRAAYACDITYGTNNEFGFDYLRDNMVMSSAERVQRGLNYVVIDEVDSILIDEARTPLIISGASEDQSELYRAINLITPHLSKQIGEGDEVETPGDFTLDEKTRQVLLTEQGHARVEQLLVESGLLAEGSSLYDVGNIALMHHVLASLKAHHIFVRNKDYIVKEGEIVIIDEFTGRQMAGRRWSEGIHQAIEAKEGVSIQAESQTLASITFQNYFRQYKRLSGMTGTADTEAAELMQIYNLEVVPIPPNRPVQRIDSQDAVYMTQKDKYAAIVDDIEKRRAAGQPILVGTASIEASELLSAYLTQKNIAHEILNAKQHEREAYIIAQAGRPGAVTIATNMAGRGTDIVLGGNWEMEAKALGDADPAHIEAMKAEWKARHEAVKASGGLHVIGTERHESRRIDNQLRGRSGRQGDPGSSRFYLSLEDDLLRIFAGDKLRGMMQKLGMKDGDVIEHPWLNRSIENAQRKVEGRNFDVRKQLLEYDNVANDQRQAIYAQRNDILDAQDLSDWMSEMRLDVMNRVIDLYMPAASLEEEWNLEGLEHALAENFGQSFPVKQWAAEDTRLNEAGIRARILEGLEASYAVKRESFGAELMNHLERVFLLQTLDHLWREHLASMDYLRAGIHLRGYAQKNPVQEFKREAFEMFRAFMDNVKLETVKALSLVRVRSEEEIAALEALERSQQPDLVAEHDEAANNVYGHEPAAEPSFASDPLPEGNRPLVRHDPKVGRNDPCPCGSGKKYKQCCGRLV
ncbi:MAG: preprotein translocase subunit SecA [Gammaproteobacteria bacterium]|nr:preprotein translocase subunit SecA [Gammaproteobacteria bacterium]